MMENYRSLRQDDEAAMYFKVFDSEHRGFIEGKAIKRSLHFLDDVPISEIEEIVAKMNLKDDKKITIEGKYLLFPSVGYDSKPHPPRGGRGEFPYKKDVSGRRTVYLVGCSASDDPQRELGVFRVLRVLSRKMSESVMFCSSQA